MNQRSSTASLAHDIFQEARADNLPAPPLKWKSFIKTDQVIAEDDEIFRLLYQYCYVNEQIIRGRIDVMIRMASPTRQIAIRQREYKIAFRDWYKPGLKFAKLTDEARNVITINRDYVLRSIAPNRTGLILQEQFRFIEPMENAQVLTRTASSLGDALSKRVANVWFEARERTLLQLQHLSRSLKPAIIMQDPNVMHDLPNHAKDLVPYLEFPISVWRQIKDVRYDVLVATSLVSVLSGLLVPIVGGLMGYVSLMSAQKQQVKSIKAEIIKSSTDAMSEIYSFFITPDPVSLTQNIVDAFFVQVLNDFTDEAKHSIEILLKTMRYELIEIERYSQLTQVEKETVISRLADKEKKWHDFRETIRSFQTNID